MQSRNNQGFDDFRRERKRNQAKRPQASALGYENRTLQELEQVEARDALDQQLSREVHDFFAAATAQAAGIVERVARDAEQEAGQKVEQEMEAFLFDALSRMNSLVVTVLQHKRGPVAETQLEPRIGNLVGPALDNFRNEGTAELYDKHIGQDPFETAVDDVQREFRAVASPTVARDDQEAVPIEEHKVAAFNDDHEDHDAHEDHQDHGEDEHAYEPPSFGVPPKGPQSLVSQSMGSPSMAPQSMGPRPPAPPPAPSQPASQSAKAPPPGDPVAESLPAPKSPSHELRTSAPRPSDSHTAPPEASPAQAAELEKFKGTLKALVRQGVMNRDEARAAWQARLQTMGLSH